MLVSLDEKIVPISYVLQLSKVAQRRGIAPKDLLANTEISEADLLHPLERVTSRQYSHVILRANALTSEPGLAILLGKEMHLTWHGPVGFAIIASDNVRDALTIATEYLPMRMPGVQVSWQIVGSDIEIRLDHQIDNAMVSCHCVATIMVFIAHAMEELLADATPPRIEVTMPRPLWFREDMIGSNVQIRFSRLANRALLPARILDLPLRSHDFAAREMALAQCEQELRETLALLGTGGQVRRALRDWREGQPSQDQVCATLGLSKRTLTRRLAEEGTSWRAIVDDVLCTRATGMLLSTALSVEQIAAALGYSDAANFARAFRRCRGQAPREFRATHGHGSRPQ